MMSNLYLLTKEYWDELEKNNPVVFKVFTNWLNDYKLRINWSAKFKANVDFFDLPADMQHGIIARFYFEAGEITEHFGESQAEWVERTGMMFSELKNRLKQLNKYNESQNIQS